MLLSDSGGALFIDYGYDMSTGWPAGTDRAARRPWLASLPALKRDFGVTSVEVVLGTHYHDDHIAGLNLLRDVEGTEVWLPENVALIMADPMRTDLPCQWFEPIPADRVLPLGETVRWREYDIVTHELLATRSTPPRSNSRWTACACSRRGTSRPRKGGWACSGRS
ncbi:MBL fold metallo-hydrolase [Leifsonia sp. L25]|uniref:MBL fold metallo-hydrolase n=1 Tax=Leifsonia sp. L25 TaxID=3423957 RepID=UPI003D68FB9F